jgi:poly-gamma-glutamate system protein
MVPTHVGRALARPRLPMPLLAVGAVLAIAVWIVAERLAGSPVPARLPEMLAAARTVQAASVVLRSEKEARGLLAPDAVDPNRTGMIGIEFSDITTTQGDLASKRTATNPDLAAVLVRLIDSLELSPGRPVVLMLSGSFVGGNVAALAAVEALGLKPVVVLSLTASMWGANQPEFAWLDMMDLLRRRGILSSTAALAVLGGEGGGGGGISAEGLRALRDSAAKAGVRLIEARPFSTLIERLDGELAAVLSGMAPPGLVINVGGSLTGLGNCRESFEVPPGLTLGPIPCTQGTPGIAMRLSAAGTPLLQVLNLRRFAAETGLPFDPVPLPPSGRSLRIYGRGPEPQRTTGEEAPL